MFKVKNEVIEVKLEPKSSFKSSSLIGYKYMNYQNRLLISGYLNGEWIDIIEISSHEWIRTRKFHRFKRLRVYLGKFNNFSKTTLHDI